MRQGSNLGWIILITAPFALAIKSLSMFGRAIATLFKPSLSRKHIRPSNHPLEDDVKRSRINLNKARQGEIHAKVRLINAKTQEQFEVAGVDVRRSTIALNRAKQDKLEAETRLIDAKAQQIRKGEEGWKKELRKMGINPEDAELMDGTDNKGINLDTMDNVELNAKDYMGCAACNFIDSTGKERFCHTCGKPLRPIHTGI